MPCVPLARTSQPATPFELLGRELANRVEHRETTVAAHHQALLLQRCQGRTFDVDLGHTDPQLIIPYGGDILVDAEARRIAVRY